MSPRDFVSVLTPFHNTAPYLAECIESVLAQTFDNFEYVLVDNQSSDGSTDIAADYARRDPRIRLLRTDRFLTQIQNYNFTLSHMSAEARYCKIVQADDWLFPRCLSDMVSAAQEYPTAGIVSAYLQAETEVWGTGLAAKPGVSFLTGREAARLHLQQPIFLFGSPTTVMYTADVVRARRPFYEEGRLHPDTEAIYEILQHHDFAFVHQVLSFTRQQEGSITWNARNLNHDELDRMIVTKRFGPVYLDPEEYLQCTRGVSRWFYGGLAREWLRSGLSFRNKAFWDRQRLGLAGVGESIRMAPFAQAVALQLAKWALRR